MSLQILRKGENEMAKKEVKTDLWVARQLDDSKIKYDAQGSDVKEINDALQSASKRGTGNAGYPEYVAVVKDFVIVIEDKADLTAGDVAGGTVRAGRRRTEPSGND